LINRFVETGGNAIFEAPLEEETMEAPAATGEGLTIAGVVFQSDTFMQTVQAGMQDAADAVGAELILANTENDLAKESSMIDDFITRGVDAIVITPISADGSVAALRKAKEAGRKGRNTIKRTFEKVHDTASVPPLARAAGEGDETRVRVMLDSGENVYNAALNLLDEAESALASGPDALGAIDLFYNEDPSKWVKLINTLRLKAYYTTSNTAAFNQVVAGGKYIQDSEDDFFLRYGDSE
jgi:hypothetical protein